MPKNKTTYTVKQLTVRQTVEGSHYEFIATIDGAEFAIAAFNTGEFEARLAEAKAAGAEPAADAETE